MKMINIYCLIDPRNNKPFYVGVTSKSLPIRLSAHIAELKQYAISYWSAKQQLIADIKQCGLKPTIRLLKIVDLYSVDYYEHFFYLMFKQQGFTLLQKPTAFFYQRKHITEKNFNAHNQRVSNNMQLCCNNIFGNLSRY